MCNIVALAAFGLALLSLLRANVLRLRFEALVEEFRRQAAPPSGRDPPRQRPVATVAAAISGSPGRAPVPSRPPLIAPRWEQTLAEHWLVWLGGLTLALGGAFLVDLSIGYGLLTPAVRVGLGVALGIGLAAGAERLRRREPVFADRQTASFYVPQALVAAAAAILFASLYAAYQLYALLPALAAFTLLAATAAAAVAMSLRHGPFVAALGLVGACLVPLLVKSPAPQAVPLFGYLVVVSAAALAVARQRGWWWLATLSLAGSIFWVLGWLGTEGEGPPAPVVGGFLLLQLALFGVFRRGLSRLPFLGGLNDAPAARILTRAACWAVAAAAVVLVQVDGFGGASLAVVLAMAVFFLWFAYRDTGLDDVLAVAAALLLAVLASWPPLGTAGPFAVAWQPAIADFAGAAFLGAVLLGGAGFIALGEAARPGRWAALSAGAPLLILAIAYWRVPLVASSVGWSGAALALAALELAAAIAVAHRRNGAVEIEKALAAYATGVLGATILAAGFALSDAWLTVALALHLPALGWVEARLQLPVLRRVALGVAGIVLIRLVANPYLGGDGLAAASSFGHLLCDYGVPALAFLAARRQFGRRGDDLLLPVLEAGGIAFSSLLLTFALRLALYGRLDAPFGDLARDAAETVLWLLLATGLLWLGERRHSALLRSAGMLHFGLATAQAVLWQALFGNPLLTGAPVGRWLVFDVPGLAFALPALLYALIVWFRLGPNRLHWVARILAVGLAFLWLTLEIRHAFRGEMVRWGEVGEAEWYAYSAAWLAFAGAGLAAGLVGRSEWLRRISLAGVGLVVAKVFLSDMAALGGLWRALSFLGLGAALVAIGWAYRWLHPWQPAAPAAETMPETV